MNKLTNTILNAQRAQMICTISVMPNSQASGVVTRLHEQGLYAEAAEYWNWSCNCGPTPEWVTAEVTELKAALKAKDNKVSMPAWGIYGI